MRRARGRVDANWHNISAEFGRITSENFKRDKKLFWKEVKNVRGK